MGPRAFHGTERERPGAQPTERYTTMSDVVKVRFKGTRRGFYTNSKNLQISVGDHVVVEGDRGEDIGLVAQRGHLAPRKKGSAGKKLPKVIKIASDEEKERLEEMRRIEKKAWQVCQQKIQEKDLPMNLVDVECSFDLSRLSFYFTAEKRVDFRELIRDMASVFRKRIKLKQIGVRDKARRKGGYGGCGMQLCCSTFLTEFEPVTLRAAKEQNLSLNPSNISGCCGRLMCCLVYERDFYKGCRKRFPRLGKAVRMNKGKEKIAGVDYFHDQVSLKNEDGEKRTISLKEFHREKKQSERRE